MSADLLLFNGNIHTMDPHMPAVRALAIRGDRIVGAGAEDAMAARLAPHARSIDLKGRTVVPGFIDAHIHFLGYGLSLHEIDLVGVPSLQAAQERVAAAAAKVPAGQWLTGRGWDQVLWPDETFPTREDLDAITPHHPAFLQRKCGHAGWANSRALTLAGITEATPDPPGGEIVRDPTSGHPTGLLLERAMDLLEDRMAEPTVAQAEAAIRRAQSEVHKLGITSIHNMEGAAALRAFQSLRRQGQLKLRVLQQLPETELDAAAEIGLQSGFGDEWIRIGAVKIFADGSLGARSALMVAPYEGEPNNVGIAVSGADHLLRQVTKAAQAGLAVYIHAIGDLANRRVLDAIERTRQAGIGTGLRHRIEHAQILHPDDVDRFAALGVIASMQPIHCTQDMVAAAAHWGERCRLAYAWSTLLGSGADLAFGSDAPVETPDVLAGIYAAVTRRRADGYPGENGWYPEECLSVRDALRAYTAAAAYAAGEEALKGTLIPGKLADLAILSDDILKVEPAAILQMRVLATMVGGNFVYEDGL